MLLFVEAIQVGIAGFMLTSEQLQPSDPIQYIDAAAGWSF